MRNNNDLNRLKIIEERWDTENAIDPIDIEWLLGFLKNLNDQYELCDASYWELYEEVKDLEDKAEWLSSENEKLTDDMLIYKSAFHAIVTAYNIPIDTDEFIAKIRIGVEL